MLERSNKISSVKKHQPLKKSFFAAKTAATPTNPIGPEATTAAVARADFAATFTTASTGLSDSDAASYPDFIADPTATIPIIALPPGTMPAA